MHINFASGENFVWKVVRTNMLRKFSTFPSQKRHTIAALEFEPNKLEKFHFHGFSVGKLYGHQMSPFNLNLMHTPPDERSERTKPMTTHFYVISSEKQLVYVVLWLTQINIVFSQLLNYQSETTCEKICPILCLSFNFRLVIQFSK